MRNDGSIIDVALKLLQEMSTTTMFDDKGFNEGMTLPFHVAKKCALVAVERLIKEEEMWNNGEVEPTRYWQSVKQEILKREL